MLSILVAMQAVVAPAPAAETVQAQFDRASAAYAAGRWDEALSGYQALEKRLSSGKNPTSLALARLRKARTLDKLDRSSEARAILAENLPVVAAKPQLSAEAYDAASVLGVIAYKDLDFPGSAAAFETALRLAATDGERIAVLPLLSRALMFDADGRSVDYAEQAITLARADKTIPKEKLAELQTMKARALLNHGDPKAALAAAREAIRLLGGLTLKSSLTDIASRSDAAIAAMLIGDKESARQYLAYTGAGRITQAPFAVAMEMRPPSCGGPDDIRPTDSAVIEFGILPEGTVAYAVPIYASRPGPMAAAFARAARDWVWKPEAVAKIPGFYRALTRVELRCTNSFETPSILALLGNDLAIWLTQQRLQPAPARGASAPEIATLRAELDRRRAIAGANGLQLVPIQLALGASPVVPFEEARGWLVDASDALTRAGAPVAARAFVDILLANVGTDNRKVRERMDKLEAVLARPEVAAEPRAASAIRLLDVEWNGAAMPAARRADLLKTVATDARLPERDPLRVGAWVRLASEQARANDLAAARVSFDQSGLSAAQCALVDATQAMTRSGASSSDYPMEAMRWGFEGWVKAEFDIGADGRTLNQRAIIAYPPFIFGQATVGITTDTRYQQTYRPQGALGCSSKTINVQFVIPG